MYPLLLVGVACWLFLLVLSTVVLWRDRQQLWARFGRLQVIPQLPPDVVIVVRRPAPEEDTPPVPNPDPAPPQVVIVAPEPAREEDSPAPPNLEPAPPQPLPPPPPPPPTPRRPPVRRRRNPNVIDRRLAPMQGSLAVPPSGQALPAAPAQPAVGSPSQRFVEHLILDEVNQIPCDWPACRPEYPERMMDAQEFSCLRMTALFEAMRRHRELINLAYKAAASAAPAPSGSPPAEGKS